MAASRPITANFFNRPTPLVARELLGVILWVNGRGGVITETEVYRGEEDNACHAHFGRTRRNETLYAAPGTLYIYLCYGMHWMLNIVTEKEGFPAAVLVRSIISYDPHFPKSHFSPLIGPGRVTKYFGIDGSFNKTSIAAPNIDLAKYVLPDAKDVNVGPRIGIGFAKEPWRSQPWRFVWQPNLSP